ncbi:MAG: helix-turn-helix transcriptional regulator [Spirochaetales bacterium]|nr:helix-turn-helix transcriptional regulator [Spirochaetales bacterium]
MAKTGIKRKLKRKWGLSYFLIMMIPFVLFVVFAVTSVSVVRSTVHKANRAVLTSVENELNSAFKQVDSLCEEVLLSSSFRTLRTISFLSDLDRYTLYSKTTELRHMLSSRNYLTECYLYSPSRNCFFSSLYYGRLEDLHSDGMYDFMISKEQNADFFGGYRDYSDIKDLSEQIPGNSSWILVLRPLSFIRTDNIGDFCMAVLINVSELIPEGMDQDFNLLIYDDDMGKVLFSYRDDPELDFVTNNIKSIQQGSAMSINGYMVISSASSMRGIRYIVMVNEGEYFKDLTNIIRTVLILLMLAVILSTIAIYRLVRRHWNSFSDAVEQSGTDIETIDSAQNQYQPFVTSVSKLKKENRSHVIARIVFNEDPSISDSVMEDIGIHVVSDSYCILLAEIPEGHDVGIEAEFSKNGFLCIPFQSEYSVSMILNADPSKLNDAGRLLEERDDLSYHAVSKAVSHVNEIHNAYIQASNMMDYRRSVFMASAGGEGYAIYSSAVAEIERNYNDPQLNVSLVADRLGVSIAYLSRCFKKNGTENISDYLTNYRIAKAKELLSLTGSEEVSVNEVSIRCGFGSLRTFMRVFKASEGITPGQFRQSLGKEE